MPVPGDFAPPPDAATRRRWTDADRAHRPQRRAALRERLSRAGIDAYFGLRPEHMRWLTGFALAEGEEKVAGHSGQFLLGREDVIVL
ncbi:MAG TPA: aminopeptidase P family N-terminal domain-containing protein, partial [Candidatus Limnocylindrales bacterium]|nr:aminopeptidase P family N-terminal domain-containing protein [Candidatus Limnocylindrales bacterium]